LHEDKLGAGAKQVNFWGEVDVFAGGCPDLFFGDEFFSFLLGCFGLQVRSVHFKGSVDHVTNKSFYWMGLRVGFFIPMKLPYHLPPFFC